MKKFLILFKSILLLMMSSMASVAASSTWQDIGGGKARLLASYSPADGQIDAALEIKLEPGWSTYWRYPGSSGIPPVFDFSHSRGFEFLSVEYPAPELLGDKHVRYAGYKKQVTFPLKGQSISGTAPDIDLNLLIGVCAHVCIPAKAEFQIKATDLMRSDPQATRILTFARISVPRPVDAGSVVRDVSEGEKRNLLITVAHTKNDTPPALFVEGPAAWYLQPGKLLEQTDETALFSLDLARAPKSVDLSRVKLKYTLAHEKTGVEFER